MLDRSKLSLDAQIFDLMTKARPVGGTQMKRLIAVAAALLIFGLLWTPAMADGPALPQYTPTPDLCSYDSQQNRIECLKLEIEKHDWLRTHWLDFSTDVRAICASWHTSSHTVLESCLTVLTEQDKKGELEDAKLEMKLRQQVEGR
jgi:hypothetical protein